MIDPVCAGGICDYLKPDTNIAIPAGVPITALLPGTVTDVSNRGAGDGGLSVTMKMDNPLNNLAQYISYNFLGNANVNVGQHLNPGDQVGVAGSPTGIDFALGLGPSPSWGSGSFPQGSGNPLTDPRQLLKSVISGTPLPQGNTLSSTTGGSTSSTQCAPWDIPCIISQTVTSDFFQRGSILFIGIVLALIGIIVLTVGNGAKIIEEHPEVAAAA